MQQKQRNATELLAAQPATTNNSNGTGAGAFSVQCAAAIGAVGNTGGGAATWGAATWVRPRSDGPGSSGPGAPAPSSLRPVVMQAGPTPRAPEHEQGRGILASRCPAMGPYSGSPSPPAP